MTCDNDNCPCEVHDKFLELEEIKYGNYTKSEKEKMSKDWAAEFYTMITDANIR